MIKDIMIGQFFPGKSLIHRLDPRVKFVLTFVYVVAVFFCKNLLSLGLLAAALLAVILLSKLSPRILWRSLRPLFILVAITSVLQILYTHTGKVLFSVGKFQLTVGGLYMAFFTTARIVLLVLASSMLTFTTSPTMLTDAMERLFSPLQRLKINVHSIAMMMTIALRFIPTLIDEVDKIMSAQKARGADMETGNLIRRGKALIPVFIPLFVNSFRRAYELAFAMECRCYGGGAGRTRLRVMKLAARDWLTLAAAVLLIAGIAVSNHFLPAVI